MLGGDVLSLEAGERNGASVELDSGQSREVLKSPNGNDEGAELVTLQFGIYKLPGPTIETPDVDVRAELSWGAGKSSHEAVIDWLRGTVITLPATAFTVKANYLRHGFGGPRVRCSVVASYGSKPGYPMGGNARLTDRLGRIGPEGARNVTVPVPRFATHATILTTSISLLLFGNVNVDAQTEGGVTLYQAEPFRMYDGEAVPLANGVEKLKISNTSSDTTAEFLIFWALCL